MLEIKNLSKKYISVQALKNVDLTFGQGEIVGLFGENGAGKTTLLKSVLGLVDFSGSIKLDGEKITKKNISRLSFATCEHSFFPNLTPNSHAEFYKEHFGAFSQKRFESLMDFFELKKNKPVKSFSTGQKNQFEVIMALCQGADYILMDEPFAGNDLFNREDFYKVLLGILEPHETVILSTHLIEEVSGFISRAILLHKGKVIGDKTTAELESEEADLVSYIKQSFNYKSDRVANALDKLGNGEDQS